MSWVCVDAPTGVQVIPVGDDLAHEDSEACACQPRVQLVAAPGVVVHKEIPTSDGPILKHCLYHRVRKLVTHSAWDGRPE